MNFVESCCREALDRRFCGDLHPYGQHIGPIRGGCKRAVFLSLFTGGFIAPYLLKFVPPPSAQNLRFSTQCRKMPEGYPYHPMNNPVLSAMFLRHKERRALSKRESKSVSWIMALQHAREAGLVKLGQDQLNELWGPTFSFWEKWSCFWRAPVTIYLANVMVQVAITSFFTRFLTSQTEPEDHVEPFEVFMIIYFASSTFTELVQVIIDGIGTYLPDFWNVIDMVALFFFWLGLAFRLQCINRHCDDLYAWTYRDPLYGELEGPKVNGFSKMFYSLSLFCLWTRLLRVLSVDKTLGPLVLVFRRMGRDTLIFGVMWMVFLMAFSVALHGSGIEPDPTTCAEGGMKASCWETWWIVRTYFQSFGEPFFSEMNSDASMLGLMICWIVMNIILVNLLIARMSSTYSRIEKQSEKEWMFDLYLATKEYMRLTASIPIPFNIVPLIIDISLFFLKRLRADKYGARGHVAETLANHLSRNNSGAPSPALLARLKFRRDQLAAQQDRGTDHDQSLRQELERMSRLLLTEEGRRMRENRELLRLNAFIERARAAFIQTGTESGGSSRLEHLEGKVNQLMGVLQNHLDPLRGALLTSEGSEDAESVQLMREKSTHSLRGW